jgi:hypothetical protein
LLSTRKAAVKLVKTTNQSTILAVTFEQALIIPLQDLLRYDLEMKLTVKTLKGGKFELECDPSQSVLEVKGLIVSPQQNWKVSSLVWLILLCLILVLSLFFLNHSFMLSSMLHTSADTGIVQRRTACS